LVRFSFVIGIVVSIIFYERRHLTTGGIAGPGYLGFVIFQPLIVPAIFFASALTYFIVHKALSRIMLIPDYAKFDLVLPSNLGPRLLQSGTLVAFGCVPGCPRIKLR